MPARKKNQNKKPANNISLYRKVVITFVILTTILLFVVLYFSFVSVSIKVQTKAKQISTDFTVEVVDSQDGLVPGRLNGVFFAKEVSGEKEFEATGSKVVKSDVVGRVTLYNNYRRPQPLIATTRLMTPDNILLRTKESVDLPVGASVEVAVYADDPAQLEGKIINSGTRLTVINLAAQLQDKIYAEAKGQIKNGENKIAVVSADDLTRAQDELLDQLKLQSFVELGIDNKVVKAVTAKVLETTASAKVGEEKDKFILRIKAGVTGVMFDRQSLLDLAESKLREQLSRDEQLVSVNYDSLSYQIETIDAAKKSAKLKVSLNGLASLRPTSKIFDKNQIKGLTKKQLQGYFAAQEGVETAQINLFPFWVNRAPRLADHIKIFVK